MVAITSGMMVAGSVMAIELIKEPAMVSWLLPACNTA